jgi:hypothetical protein
LLAADYHAVRTQIGQTSITMLRRNIKNRQSGEDISASDMVVIVLSPCPQADSAADRGYTPCPAGEGRVLAGCRC